MFSYALCRNIFIFNLALSDLLLVRMTSDKHKLQCDTGLHSANNKTIACYMQCILSISQAVSIPFTLFDALTRSWPLPYSWLSCRFARESRMFYKWIWILHNP